LIRAKGEQGGSFLGAPSLAARLGEKRKEEGGKKGTRSKKKKEVRERGRIYSKEQITIGG